MRYARMLWNTPLSADHAALLIDRLAIPDGAHVLDLFSGSGALGLEAASRGAESVVLVERERGAANVAQRNAEIVAKAGAVRALVEQVAAHQYLQRSGRQFDLVFVDPVGTGWSRVIEPEKKADAKEGGSAKPERKAA